MNHSSLAMSPDKIEVIIDRLKASISGRDFRTSKTCWPARPTNEACRYAMDLLSECTKEDVAEIVIRLVLSPDDLQELHDLRVLVEGDDTVEMSELKSEIKELKYKLDTIRWEAEY